MSEPMGSKPAVPFANPQVNLYSGDLEASVRFYREVLGFRETFRLPKEGAPDHIELKLDTLTLGIAAYAALSHHTGLSAGPGPARFELDFMTDDVDGAYGWSVAHGAPSLRAPYDFLGYIHSSCVADPDGNHVVFDTRLPLQVAANASAPPKIKTHLYNLYTHHLEESLVFYRDLLGFVETFRVPEQGPAAHVEMELGPLNLGLSTVEALERDHGLTGGGGPPRGELVVWVPDADAAFSWLTGHGVRTVSTPHDFAGILRAGWVTDPDGNPVQVVSRSARSG